jgi:hypothetical protein
MPDEALATIAGNASLVQAIAGISDVEQAAVLLGKIACTTAGAAQAVRHIGKFDGFLSGQTVVLALARIAARCPDEVLAQEWAISTIARSLRKLENVGENLSVVLGLASSEQIVAQKVLMKVLTRLLTSAECDVGETAILIEIFAKISPHFSLVEVYQYLLQAAESRNDYCSFALTALAQQSLPKLTTRYSVRLLAIVREFLASENDAQQRSATDVLARMSKRAAYIRPITEILFPIAMQKTLTTTHNADVFESLLQSAKQCQIRVTPGIVRAAEHLARDLTARTAGNGSATDASEKARSIVALANELL